MIARVAVFGLSCWLLACSSASAEESRWQRAFHPLRPRPVEVDSHAERMRRAGHPQRISPLAAPSIHPRKDSGYYVGGSALLPGHPRHARTDGTWGVDYRGWPLRRRIWLGWKQGRHGPPAPPAYATER